MLFKDFCEYLKMLESTTERLRMVSILAKLFKEMPPEEAQKAAYLLLGELYPDWMGLPELGVAEKMCLEALSRASGISKIELEKMLKQVGDMGELAEKVAQRKKLTTLLTQQLTVTSVYDSLTKVAMATGAGSQDMKIRILTGLFLSASPIEARYIARIVLGTTRLGIQEMTILDGLAQAFLGTKEKRPIIEEAFNKYPDIGYIARIVAREGEDGLRKIKAQPGVPIRPMLAERLSDPKEILDKVGGEAIAEYKYDGERAQIHKTEDGRVVIFSRRLENITEQYPDVREAILEAIQAGSFIVEGEIVCIDPDTNELRPFQELMHRKRKYDIARAMQEYPTKVFLFDCLFLNGEELLDKPYPERRKILESIVKTTDSVELAKAKIIKTSRDLEEFMMQAVGDGCEGIIVKSVRADAVYEAGARGWKWIKYKRDYRSEMIDTIDLVVVGAFYGKGRRSGTYGALLCAAYNSERDVFETVCKVGSGFTDSQLAELPSILGPYITKQKPPNVDVSEMMEPDVWVYPKIVMEVLGAEITLSPVHTCGKDIIQKEFNKEAGLAIRFPRFVNWRPDKGPTDATTSGEIFEMYLRQLKKVQQSIREQ